MDRFHGSFDEWLAQYKDPPHEGGGYLIPSTFSVYADGFIAWIYRLIGNKADGELLTFLKPLESKCLMAELIEARALRSGHHKLVDVVPLSTPYAIFLDFCSACNYKCKYCPTGNSQLLHDIGRKPALMNLELFTKVVNGLREFPEKVKRINLYKDGESTLHPKFCEMVRYLKDANVANSIWVKTNGSTLSPSFNEKLVNCGLDMIGISVQGVTSQAFYDIAGVRVDYEKYRMNVLDLFERSRGKCQVSIKVADVGQPETEKQKFIDIPEIDATS